MSVFTGTDDIGSRERYVGYLIIGHIYYKGFYGVRGGIRL
jgi:hypothetical protein